VHPQKKAMLSINVVGGVAVLGSYAHGLLSHPGDGTALWGGAPQEVRSLYAAGMLLAALGYFAFTYYLLRRLDPVEARVGKRFGFGVFNWLYAAILAPSALWMPLTWLMIEQPGAGLWGGIRAVLATVGLAALGLVMALSIVRPKEPKWAHRLALIGSIVFCAHTAVLDALVWPALFRA
jgi:hypothetical protein